MQQSRPGGPCRILLQDLPERQFLQLMEREGSNVHARKSRIEWLNELFLGVLEKVNLGDMVALEIRNALVVVQGYLLYSVAVI